MCSVVGPYALFGFVLIMVCVETGKIIEFTNDEIERLQHEIATKHKYELIDHNLVLYVKPIK